MILGLRTFKMIATADILKGNYNQYPFIANRIKLLVLDYLYIMVCSVGCLDRAYTRHNLARQPMRRRPVLVGHTKGYLGWRHQPGGPGPRRAVWGGPDMKLNTQKHVAHMNICWREHMYQQCNGSLQNTKGLWYPWKSFFWAETSLGRAVASWNKKVWCHKWPA